jgi:3-keto-5-aminohexanoate cleavage enzyme
MLEKVIVCAALSGAATTKAMAPTVPVTSEEIALETINVVKAGASIVHIHVKEPDGTGTMDTNRFVEAYEAINNALNKEGLDVIINLTTSGVSSGIAPDDIRLRHLELLKPEMCSFDAGTMNWGCNIIFENSPRFLEKLCKSMSTLGIKPEIEIFDGGMLGNVEYYVKKGLLTPPCHYQFVLGVLGGLAATTENLVFLQSKIPKDATWSVTGIGRGHIPMLLAGLSMGCTGIRVGLEDNIYLKRGVIATNVQLVERAVKIARLSGREPATAQEARKILGIAKKE